MEIKFSFCNRRLMNQIDEQMNVYGGLLNPLSGTTTETFLPVYGTSGDDSFPTKPPHTDSDLMYTLPPRKRSKGDTIYQYQQIQNHRNNNFSFLGEDISFLIQYQQFEIDNFISQHVSISIYLQFDDFYVYQTLFKKSTINHDYSLFVVFIN